MIQVCTAMPGSPSRRWTKPPKVSKTRDRWLSSDWSSASCSNLRTSVRRADMFVDILVRSKFQLKVRFAFSSVPEHSELASHRNVDVNVRASHQPVILSRE